MDLIQNCMIEEVKRYHKQYIGCNNYKELDFSKLTRGYQPNSGDFFQNDRICFEDHIGSRTLTGNELFYYPELAKALQSISEYPVLTRSYSIDKTIKGMDFIKYFYKRTYKAFLHFQRESQNVSKKIDKAIHLYGTKRYMPLIDGLEVESTPGFYKAKILVINGIKWYLRECFSDDCKITQRIDLRSLLNISCDFSSFEVEEIIPGTPFMSIRLFTSGRSKGRVTWYNLDTCQKVFKIERMKWKKPT